MLSGIGRSYSSPADVRVIKAWLCLMATPGTEACDAVGGALRPKWREWPSQTISLTSAAESQFFAF